MVETIYTLITVAALYLLFRKRPPYPGLPAVREKTWKLVVAGAGVLLIAIPGLITLATLCQEPEPPAPLADSPAVALPDGEGVALLDARAFVVRGFVVTEATVDRPCDFFSGVLNVGTPSRFELKDGDDLDIRLHRDYPADGEGDERVAITCHWSTTGSSKNYRGHVAALAPATLESKYTLYERTFDRPEVDRAAFGSLLANIGGKSKVRLFLTPVKDAESVVTRPVEEWWNESVEAIEALLTAEPHSGSDTWGGISSSSRNLVGNVLTPWAVLFLAVGSLLILIATTSRIRTLCLLILYLCLYTGAVDSFVLRCQSARLGSDDPALALAAAHEVAATRLHPQTAVHDLIARAESEDDPRTSRALLRCLDRRELIRTLVILDDSRSDLDRIAAEREGDLAREAERIGKAVRNWHGHMNVPVEIVEE